MNFCVTSCHVFFAPLALRPTLSLSPSLSPSLHLFDFQLIRLTVILSPLLWIWADVTDVVGFPLVPIVTGWENVL